MTDKSPDDHAKQLAEAVMEWWEKHQYDTIPLGDGDEDNVFDETPDFVKRAARYLGLEEPS